MHNFSAPQKSRPRPRLPSQIAPPRLFISAALARPPNCITLRRRNHPECGRPRKEHAPSRRTTNSRKVDYTTPSNYSMSHTRNIPEIKKIYTVYSCLFGNVVLSLILNTYGNTEAIRTRRSCYGMVSRRRRRAIIIAKQPLFIREKLNS